VTHRRDLQGGKGDELKSRAAGALPVMKRANERADRGKSFP